MYRKSNIYSKYLLMFCVLLSACKDDKKTEIIDISDNDVNLAENNFFTDLNDPDLFSFYLGSASGEPSIYYQFFRKKNNPQEDENSMDKDRFVSKITHHTYNSNTQTFIENGIMLSINFPRTKNSPGITHCQKDGDFVRFYGRLNNGRVVELLSVRIADNKMPLYWNERPK